MSLTSSKHINGRRFIIAGGGTGGHIFPAIAIANALKEIDPAAEILFVGAKGKMEMEKVPQAGFNIEGIDIAGFNRSSLLKNISLPLKLIKSFFQVRKIINAFKPDAVIGVGGYSSFPVLRFAQAKGIATFIHESNSFAGKSNMLLGKKAVKVFTGSAGMEKFFPSDKIIITGNPVRKTITESKVTREEGLAFFGLESQQQTVLVVGGSLGARSVNEAIDAGVAQLIKNGLQLIWQTGKLYVAKAAEKSAEHKEVWANDFIQQMEMAYAAADIVVARAGAMTVAELCVVQKPVIFVPYPFAAEDHQTVNAQQLVVQQAAWMVKDSEVKEVLIKQVVALAEDIAAQQTMKLALNKLSITNADKVIAATICELIK